MEIVNPRDAELLRDNADEFQEMGEDLGLLGEGEGFMAQDPRWFPVQVQLALWKRLRSLEAQSCLCRLEM